MSKAALVSPATRLLAPDWKATKRPSALTAAPLALPKLLPLAWVPSLATETRTVEGVQPVAPRQVSRIKMSMAGLVSPATRLFASDWKATKRPSALTAAPGLTLLALVPSLATESRSSTRAGNVGLMANVRAVEVPPPGEGLKTATCALPAAAMSLAGIEAANWVPLTKVVVRSAPFQRNTEPEIKFEPVAVRVNP